MSVKFAFLAAISLFASAAFAEGPEVLDLSCKRSSISSYGFRDMEVANNWFPPQFHVILAGDDAYSDDYGKGTVEHINRRKKISFPIGVSDGTEAKIKIVYIEKTSVYSVILETPGGYQRTAGARGKCILEARES